MFKLLHDAEDSWWYKGRAAIVSSLLSRFSVKGGSALDFGAGFGGMCGILQKVCARVSAFEPDLHASAAARTRGYAHVFDSEKQALGSQYDLVGLFDVMEHIEDDVVFLRRVREALAERGVVVITVPAYQWLWSDHDVGNKHFRRYTRTSLVKVLAESGYHIEYAGYWNMFLFLPAALVRLLGKSGGDALRLPRLLNALLFLIIRIESLLVRFVRLPFGLSVVVVASKRT